MKKKKEIWFPGKKYGMGWRLPVAWQGWASLIGYLLLATTGSVMLSNTRDLLWFLPFLLIIASLFIFICRRKGEKPGLRWGNKIK